MKTKSKLGAYILRGSTAVLLFSGVIVALCSAINLPFVANGRASAAFVATSVIRTSRPLTFAERVAYQTAIEDVYWRHRIWPKTNPDPKPPLNAVMSQADIEKKVEDYLRNSQMLETYTQRRITADQLQAEMERMARDTKQPEVLQELFAALGNDPFVIAECLARPILAERLVTHLAVAAGVPPAPRNSFAAGTAASTESRIRVTANVTYTLPEIANPSGGCTDDTWTPTTLTGAPTARADHTAVWTGSEMIVWGGGDGTNPLNTGGRYNPSTGSWTATSTTNAPEARFRHTAVWTGSEMIVWGGRGAAYFDTGGRYNPSTDSWTATSTTNAPSARFYHTAVWTGSEMIVWGGDDTITNFNTGGRYDPSTDNWTPTSTTNAPSGRYSHTAVWADSEMIIWGGWDGSQLFNTGGRYDPSTDSWTATSTTNAPAGRNGHRAVWDDLDNLMIVWGGSSSGGPSNTGGRYNPATDSWTATSLTNVPEQRGAHAAIWTGREMIVWGGYGVTMDATGGGRYDPGTDSWTATSLINEPAGRRVVTGVWTGTEMIVWGGIANITRLNTGGRYCAQFVSPTPSPTPACTPEYLINQIGGSVVAGTTDIGNHGDDMVTTIALPFPYTLYDQMFTQIALDSNGKAHFPAGSSDYDNTCLPYPVTYAAYPYWDDLRTDTGSGCAGYPGGTCGIYTSVSGTAPDRIFNIEWRTVYFDNPSQTANFELRLHEG